MLNGLFKLINCCKERTDLDKYIIKEEKIDFTTNEFTDKNHTTLNEESLKKKIKNENKDSIITFSDNRVKENKVKKRVLDTLVIGAREIILEGEMFYNKIITIDKVGIKNETRTEQNGITIFGISDNFNENCGIDFNLNLSKKKLKNKNDNTIPLFKIEYSKVDENYIFSIINKDIKALLFIENDFLIENNTSLYFMIGKIPIKVISPKSEKEDKFYIECEGKNYTFHLKDLPITIGRGNSKINIKNNSISKTHAIIGFNEDSDSLFIRDNGSTNGTFFVIDEHFPFIYLLSDCTLKILESKFTIKIQEN